VSSGDDYGLLLAEGELIGILQACGLKRDVASLFIARTCLHRSSRDMFDCPLIRVAPSKYLLFAPAVIDVNVAMAVLSNLSNRGEELGRKGKAFEDSIHEVFRKHGMGVFAFRVRRDGEEFEYDAGAVRRSSLLEGRRSKVSRGVGDALPDQPASHLTGQAAG
jgi:hypothetical protein